METRHINLRALGFSLSDASCQIATCLHWKALPSEPLGLVLSLYLSTTCVLVSGNISTPVCVSIKWGLSDILINNLTQVYGSWFWVGVDGFNLGHFSTRTCQWHRMDKWIGGGPFVHGLYTKLMNGMYWLHIPRNSCPFHSCSFQCTFDESFICCLSTNHLGIYCSDIYYNTRDFIKSCM